MPEETPTLTSTMKKVALVVHRQLLDRVKEAVRLTIVQEHKAFLATAEVLDHEAFLEHHGVTPDEVWSEVSEEYRAEYHKGVTNGDDAEAPSHDDDLDDDGDLDDDLGEDDDDVYDGLEGYYDEEGAPPEEEEEEEEEVGPGITTWEHHYKEAAQRAVDANKVWKRQALMLTLPKKGRAKFLRAALPNVPDKDLRFAKGKRWRDGSLNVLGRTVQTLLVWEDWEGASPQNKKRVEKSLRRVFKDWSLSAGAPNYKVTAVDFVVRSHSKRPGYEVFYNGGSKTFAFPPEPKPKAKG